MFGITSGCTGGCRCNARVQLYDWYDPWLKATESLNELRKENAELKLKLEKTAKRIPEKGSPVRDKKDGQIAYSCGFCCGTALSVCAHPQDEEEILFMDWEEIEIKVKE